MLGSIMLMIWLPANAFRSVPRQQEEAARDVGAGPIRTFLHVTLPMAWPGIAVAAMFTFIGSLGENQGTLLVGLPKYRTMPVELYGVILITLLWQAQFFFYSNIAKPASAFVDEKICRI